LACNIQINLLCLNLIDGTEPNVCAKFVLMIFTTKIRNNLFVGFAVLFLSAAIYHFIGIIYTINDSPVWKHSLFVVIDLFFVYAILKRTKYFVYLFSFFLLEQYYSHGTYLIDIWSEKHQVHWISVFILILLPIALICLIEENKQKKKGYH